MDADDHSPESSPASSFSKLPSELLWEIFDYIIDNVIWTHKSWEFAYAGHRKLLAVCRSWRHMLHDRSSLWTTMSYPAPGGLMWISKHIKYSKDCSLTVTIRLPGNIVPGHPINEEFRDALVLIFLHLSRICALDVYIPQRFSPLLLRVLHQPAPALRHLKLRELDLKLVAYSSGISIGNRTQIWRNTFPFASSLHQLTHLSIVDIDPNPTFTWFFEILSSMPNLEFLECSPLPEGAIPRPGSLHISLPSLRLLRLKGSVVICGILLMYITITPQTDIHFDVDFQGNQYECLSPFLSGFGKGPNGQCLVYVQDLQIIAEGLGTYEIRAAVASKTGKGLRPEGLVIRFAGVSERVGWTFLLHVANILPLRFLRSLVVSNFPLTGEQWRENFGHLEHLESISFSKKGQNYFPWGLGALMKVLGSAPIVFPYLKSIAISQSLVRELFDGLCVSLQFRKDHGHPLESVAFHQLQAQLDEGHVVTRCQQLGIAYSIGSEGND